MSRPNPAIVADLIHQHPHEEDAIHPPPPAYELVPPPIIPSERAGDNRPSLPYRARNLFLHQGMSPTANDPDALVVKFQTIVRDGKEIIVGRLKVPTLLPAPMEHAFILRRYDTGAISVTTMYKAAFPSATGEEEDREMKWIKSSFDMSGMNGSRSCNAVKLAGNWAPLNLAKHLAPAYKLESWIDAMCTARPEVGVAYRKSQRSQRAAEEATRGPPTGAAANPPAVPVPSAAPPAAPVAPVSPVQSARQAPAGTPSRRGVMSAPVPVDVVPGSNAAPTAVQAQAPKSATPARAVKRSRLSQADQSPAANASSTATDRMETDAPAPAPTAPDHVTVTLQSTHELHAPLTTSASALTAAAEAEIAASKADVLRLREEALARSAAGESALEMGLVAAQPGISGGPGSSLAKAGTGGVRGVKRTTEDAVDGEEEDAAAPDAAVTALTNSGEGRVIAGNRRVVNPDAAARRQGVWGGVALAAGLAASYIAGNFLL